MEIDKKIIKKLAVRATKTVFPVRFKTSEKSWFNDLLKMFLSMWNIGTTNPKTIGTRQTKFNMIYFIVEFGKYVLTPEFIA